MDVGTLSQSIIGRIGQMNRDGGYLESTQQPAAVIEMLDFPDSCIVIGVDGQLRVARSVEPCRVPISALLQPRFVRPLGYDRWWEDFDELSRVCNAGLSCVGFLYELDGHIEAHIRNELRDRWFRNNRTLMSCHPPTPPPQKHSAAAILHREDEERCLVRLIRQPL